MTEFKPIKDPREEKKLNVGLSFYSLLFSNSGLGANVSSALLI